MRILFVLVALFFPMDGWWAVRQSGVESNLRGVCVVADAPQNDSETIWASGSNGAVARSTDSGKSWQRLWVPGAETLDLRGVQAFDANTAYIMSSGEGSQSRIYKTTDGGKSWKLQYEGTQKEFFLDALVCDDRKRCVALSDPVDGKFVLLANTDGEHWSELPRDGMPAALPKEGAFAASNSGLCFDGKDIFFGTGGPAARVFESHDNGGTWSVVETPITSGNTSSGIFSLVCDGHTIVAVGGDYQKPGRADKNVAVSNDDGKMWQLATQPPAGYRSAAGKYNAGYVAVGPSGEETSADGLRWSPAGSESFNSYSFSSAAGKGWAAGPHGSVAEFVDRAK